MFSFNTFPNRSQIFKLVKHFAAHGTWEDRETSFSPSGPLISIPTLDNVTRVQEKPELSKSLQCRSQELGVSVSSAKHILVKDLELYPY